MFTIAILSVLNFVANSELRGIITYVGSGWTEVKSFYKQVDQKYVSEIDQKILNQKPDSCMNC